MSTIRHSHSGVLPGRAGLALALSTALALASGAAMATPWMASPVIAPTPTDAAPAGPDVHPGKEFSDELDRNATDGTDDDGQVVLWDGAGGTADGIDLGEGFQVDAIANNADALFDALIANDTAAGFSLRTPGDTSSSSGGADVGAPVHYETTGGGIAPWATVPQVDDMNTLANLDGLEVWGPEGPTLADSDTNRYSTVGDAGGTSIFNADGSSYLLHSILASAVIAFDPVIAALDAGAPSGLVQSLIDLDALMVSDSSEPGRWTDGDRILFSLWPLIDFGLLGSGGSGTAPVTVYHGDAAYVGTFSGSAKAPSMSLSFFDHGGHLWTDGWTGTRAEFNNEPVNVDAIEALASVPEPGALALIAAGLLGAGMLRRRRRA